MGAAAAPIAMVSSVASLGMSFASAGEKFSAAGLQEEAAGIQASAAPLQRQAGQFQFQAAGKQAEAVEMQAGGTAAEYNYKATRALEAAKFGRLQAGMTDAVLRENLNTTLANIDAIRAGGNVDPSSPTGAVIAENEGMKSDRQRVAQLVTLRTQADDDEASAAYLRKVGEYALLTGKKGAEGILFGGQAALSSSEAAARATLAQAKGTQAGAKATTASAYGDIASGIGKIGSAVRGFG
jgi:hypothetical protein